MDTYCTQCTVLSCPDQTIPTLVVFELFGIKCKSSLSTVTSNKITSQPFGHGCRDRKLDEEKWRKKSLPITLAGLPVSLYALLLTLEGIVFFFEKPLSIVPLLGLPASLPTCAPPTCLCWPPEGRPRLRPQGTASISVAKYLAKNWP